jgi:hypothetical protein
MDRNKVITNTVKLLEKAKDKDLRLFYQLAYLVGRRE